MGQSEHRKDTGKPSTPEDARLLVEIMNGVVAEQALEGMELLWAYEAAPTFEAFIADHAKASDEYRNMIAVLTLFERIGTFVKHQVLNEVLVLDMLWATGPWERCQNIVSDLRSQRENERLFENFEWLARREAELNT
jgi:hypothetical protein